MSSSTSNSTALGTKPGPLQGTSIDFERRYQMSEKMRVQAEALIPLGSQTFSKSKTQFPPGVSPYFITHGSGSRVWDVDDNEYIDFINGLAAITLGYNDPMVTAAVESQLQNGVIFSLPHPLEMAVSQQIIDMVPCAEMVRFGKNGSDATSGCIRLARAHTGRDRIALCGYHGWHDWYIGTTTKDRGVPKAVSELSHTFPYNDLGALEALLLKYPGEFAAVILEPMNLTYPEPGYLDGVKALAHHHGALLVFDETITGFRFANGGAQSYFNVTPDLASFGKGLANGFPLSAIAGRADIMRTMEDIFYSFTFGGETLSLAAAQATLHTLQTQPVIEHLFSMGEILLDGIHHIIQEHQMEHLVSTAGLPCWSFMVFKDTEAYPALTLKTYFLQEMFARGILTLGTHNLSFSHTLEDINTLLAVYQEVLPNLKRGVETQSLETQLHCLPLSALFKIR